MSICLSSIGRAARARGLGGHNETRSKDATRMTDEVRSDSLLRRRVEECEN